MQFSQPPGVCAYVEDHSKLNQLQMDLFASCIHKISDNELLVPICSLDGIINSCTWPRTAMQATSNYNLALLPYWKQPTEKEGIKGRPKIMLPWFIYLRPLSLLALLSFFMPFSVVAWRGLFVTTWEDTRKFPNRQHHDLRGPVRPYKHYNQFSRRLSTAQEHIKIYSDLSCEGERLSTTVQLKHCLSPLLWAQPAAWKSNALLRHYRGHLIWDVKGKEWTTHLLQLKI